MVKARRIYILEHILVGRENVPDALCWTRHGRRKRCHPDQGGFKERCKESLGASLRRETSLDNTGAHIQSSVDRGGSCFGLRVSFLLDSKGDNVYTASKQLNVINSVLSLGGGLLRQSVLLAAIVIPNSFSGLMFLNWRLLSL